MLTFVESIVFPIDDFHLRRGLIGASCSRAWASVESEGVRRVVSIRHQGSGANAANWETQLSGAMHAYADLPDGDATAAEVAEAWATAMEGLGMSCVVDGAEVTVANSSALLVGSPMTYNPALRGMWGAQRNFDGTMAVTPNNDGAMGGIGSVHIAGPSSAGRIIGVYIRAGGSGAVRLGVANGPVHSATPTAFSGGVEGVAANSGGLRLLRLAEPMAMSASSNKWINFVGAGGGDPALRYRLPGDAIEGNGDLTIGETLLFSSNSSDPNTPIYTAGAYTHSNPAGGSPYSIYSFVGFIYEISVAGSYPGDGGIVTAIGTHTTATAGTPTATIAADMDAETFGMRHLIPWDCSVTAVDVSIAANAPDEDLGLAFYSFGDVVAPSVEGATLLRDVGAYGVAGTGYQRHTLATPLPVTAGTILAVYFNAGNDDGSTPTDTISVNYDPDTGNALLWSTAWIDDGRTWNDMDPTGGGGYGVLTEYRTRGAFGGLMPEADPSATWPANFLVDGSDDNSVRNHLRHRLYVERAGITGSEG